MKVDKQEIIKKKKKPMNYLLSQTYTGVIFQKNRCNCSGTFKRKLSNGY